LQSSIVSHAQAIVTENPARRIHLHFLDGLRALAAIYVMVGHACIHEPLPVGKMRSITTLLSMGHFAVGVFIVLSGFCLMLPVVRGGGTLAGMGGIKRFFQRRARRILPPYYFAMGLSLLLIWLFIGQQMGTHWDQSTRVGWDGIAAHLLLLQDFFGKGQINHVFWSVAVEWQIYFLFPVLVLLWQRAGGLRTALTTVLLTYVLGLLAARNPTFVSSHPQFIGLFALGMLGASIAFAEGDLWPRLRARIPWKWMALVLFLIAAGAGIIFHHMPGITIYMDPIIGLFTMSLILAAMNSGPNAIRTVLESRPLVFVGTFSYSLYLIHAPLLQLIWQYAIHPLRLGPERSVLLLATLGSALIIGATYLFYLVCERPFLNTRPNQIPAGGAQSRP
jgi:peptidoglycan/LPS O-acetylase OafA/YrhL